MSKKTKKETLAARIVRLREVKDLNRLELAALAGVSQGTLQLLEKGVTQRPSAKVIAKLAEALEVEEAELIGEDAGAVASR